MMLLYTVSIMHVQNLQHSTSTKPSVANVNNSSAVSSVSAALPNRPESSVLPSSISLLNEFMGRTLRAFSCMCHAV